VFGKDLPLWKTATISFLQIVKECGPRINAFGKGMVMIVVRRPTLPPISYLDIPDERVEGICRQVIDVFRGGILADW
jgi:hypothetical protein